MGLKTPTPPPNSIGSVPCKPLLQATFHPITPFKPTLHPHPNPTNTPQTQHLQPFTPNANKPMPCHLSHQPQTHTTPTSQPMPTPQTQHLQPFQPQPTLHLHLTLLTPLKPYSYKHFD